jgi:hypothetical protein
MALSACGLVRCGAPKPLDEATLKTLYADPLPPPGEALSVYHLGHSLVGRDMPAMLAQLAGGGHGYDSQLGWGTPLKSHWTGEINGFDTENAHDRYRDAEEALASGAYDAVVLTEMVEIRDAIKYHDSWDYAARWTGRARAGNPEARVYMYESWHKIDDPEGWLTRLDLDLGRYWQGEILDRAMAAEDPPQPIYLIPAGQVFAAFVRALEARGGVDGLTAREDLFARDDAGKIDPIHVNDLGAYLVALTHYAVLYHKSPVGLPHALDRADGSPADAPGPAAARLMQETVWEVVTRLPRTGVAPQPD